MGLWDLFGGKKHRLVAVGTRKPGRRTGATDKTPRKRRTAVEIFRDRFLLNLEKTEPAMFKELMFKQLGLGQEDQGDDLDRLLKLDEKIQKLQRIRGGGGGPGGTNDSSGLVGVVRDVLQAMPAARDILAMQKDGQEAPQASTPSPASISPAIAAPANPPSAPVSPPEPLGDLLVRELEHRNPTEAADFLRHQAHYPELTRFLTELVNVPDAFLGSVIAQIRALAGWEQVGELLARKGETWLKETRDELRKHLAPAAASSNGHAESPTPTVRVTGL